MKYTLICIKKHRRAQTVCMADVWLTFEDLEISQIEEFAELPNIETILQHVHAVATVYGKRGETFAYVKALTNLVRARVTAKTSGNV